MLRERPGVMVRLPRVNAMLASRACRSSIMIGTALNAVRAMGKLPAEAKRA